ncbi:MAG TPA: hypothetical protein VII52_07190 [Gemmatimonadaceae bacterium]
MMDLLYVLATLGFFGAMLMYVAFCERLGRPASDDAARDGSRPAGPTA